MNREDAGGSRLANAKVVLAAGRSCLLREKAVQMPSHDALATTGTGSYKSGTGSGVDSAEQRRLRDERHCLYRNSRSANLTGGDANKGPRPLNT